MAVEFQMVVGCMVVVVGKSNSTRDLVRVVFAEVNSDKMRAVVVVVGVGPYMAVDKLEGG